MSLLYFVLAIVVVGVLLYVINAWIPMEPRVKNILNWVLIILLVIWILKVLGVWAYLAGMQV